MINFGSDDIGGTKLPYIPEAEIEKFIIQEDLTELERIKILLSKKNYDQKAYFFINIENIFKLDSSSEKIKVNSFED